MNKTILLTSSSEIKKDAVLNVFPGCNIISIKNTMILPEQPMGVEEGVFCAKARIPSNSYDSIVISIENFIIDDGPCDSVCVVLKYPSGEIKCAVGGDKSIIHSQYQNYNRDIHGTYGEYISTIYTGLDPKNWIGDRVQQITGVLEKILRRTSGEQIEPDLIGAYLDYTPDFPKHGVLFKDMSPLFNARNIGGFLTMCTNVLDNYMFNHVVGLESRGFHIGALIAKQEGASFHMARKAGKLPPPTVLVKYGTEYSTDAMEMRDAQLTPGSVLIVDDLIATGGSISAVTQIVKQITVPGTKIYCFAPLKVTALEQQATDKFKELDIEWIKC